MTDAETVIYRLQEAGRTLLSMPNKGCLPAGFGSGWPEMANAVVEAYVGDGEITARAAAPDSGAIGRMDEAFRWMALIEHERRTLRRIVLMRCLVSPITDRHKWSWRKIGRSLGCDVRAVERWHAQGIDAIVAALNGEAKVHRVPAVKTRKVSQHLFEVT